MEVLYLNLAVVYLFSLIARYFSKVKNGIVLPNKLLVFVVIVILVLVSGLRNNIGDTFFYMYSYTFKQLTWNDIDFTGDFGFNLLQMYLQRISPDPQLLIFITALFTNVLIVIAFYKYSRLFELSLYVYITAGMFLVSMNGIRQFLAASVLFIASKYIINGDWKKYGLVVLFASTIHQSALILIPIYFIVRRKAWTKETFLLLFTSIIIVIGFNQFSSILFTAIEGTHYGQYASFDEGGANILRVVIYAAPLILAYLGREKFRLITPYSDIIVNLALINLVFMIISTQNWIFARFTIYFGLYNILLISWVVTLFTEKQQKLVYFGIIGCYLFYFFYEHVMAMGIQYKSNYLIL